MSQSTGTPPPDHSVRWEGVVAGALGGLVGAWAMEQFQSRFSRATADDADAAQRRSGHAPTWSARSQDQLSGEPRPATVQTADLASQAVAARRLAPAEQDVAGPFMHYTFGVSVGAAYGAIAESRPEVTRMGGVPFGLSVWSGADEFIVPALGLSAVPWRRPVRAHTYSFLSHVVYGLTTEAVRRAVRTALR